MLGLTKNINININSYEYPVYFEKRNICVHCGAENTLTFVDKFGRETNKDIHPFDHIKCKSCGRTYSIKWNRNENGKMHPVATDHTLYQEFINLIDQRNIRKNGEKIF